MAALRYLGHGSMPPSSASNVVTEPHARVVDANTHDKHVAFAAYIVLMHG